MLRFKLADARGFVSGAPVLALSVLLSGCDASPRLPAPAPAERAQLTTPRQADAQREDLDAFVRGFFKVDASYSPEARAEAARRLDELSRDAGGISDALFVLRLSQIAALADNGHTGVIYRGNAPELGRVGVRLVPFGEDFVVVEAVADHADLLGGRLVAIDATPIDKLREVARTLTGGVPSRRDQMAPLFLESPGQLHALDLARAPERATYFFEMRNGKTREAALAVVSEPGGVQDTAMALLSPEAAPKGFRTLLPRKKTPWSLQDIGETMRRRDLPALNAMLIQLRANHDGEQAIAEFLNEAEAARRKARRRNVILDMRMNGGGDLTTTREWMSALPSRLPKNGRVVMLISRWTFSAGISSVGYVKQAGGSRVILVGEAPGDRLNFFAEGQPITLPNSGARVQVATQRHDYVSGCKGYSDCYGQVVEFPIEVENLEPAVKAPWTLDAYVKGRDPGMDAASRVLRRGR